MGRWVLHVDLDEFLAACEVLRRPELAGLPLVVGGNGDPTERGVASTASYPARAFGVRSGMPLRTALKRCPDCVFLPVDKPYYEAISADVMAVLKGMDAVVEVIGWDEAFMGVVTDAPEAATRLHCSVGIGANKLVAKMATDLGKPRGVGRIEAADWYPLFGEQPVDRLHGIGSRTARRLEPLGIRTVNDLAAADDAALAAAFGPTIGPWLRRIARGDDRSPVVGDPWKARSRGRETTFQRDLTDWDDVRREVSRLAAVVAADVAEEGRPAVRVVVKLRTSSFRTSTHGVPLAEPTGDPAALETAAQAALARFTPPGRGIRLLGVRADLQATGAGASVAGMADIERATSVGQTGGLPGDNADPATRYLTDDEAAAQLPPANHPTASTDENSGDDGTTAEGDAYDEPDPEA